MQEKLSDIEYGWTFVEVSSHYAKAIKDNNKKHIRKRLRVSLLNVLSYSCMPFKKALKHYPEVKEQWLEEFGDLEIILTIENDEERADYIKKKYL